MRNPAKIMWPSRPRTLATPVSRWIVMVQMYSPYVCQPTPLPFSIIDGGHSSHMISAPVQDPGLAASLAAVSCATHARLKPLITILCTLLKISSIMYVIQLLSHTHIYASYLHLFVALVTFLISDKLHRLLVSQSTGGKG